MNFMLYILQVSLVAPLTVSAASGGMMRRHKVLMASNFDGSFETLRWHLHDKSEMPVDTHFYKVAFEMDGRLFCWQRETEGCRQFAGDCEVKYCDPEICDCMWVKVQSCGNHHLELFTEADWDPDPTEEGPLRTQYWRGIRVQYYDPSKWGSNVTVDVGKALETTLSCMNTTGCSCHHSSWFHWSYAQMGGNLAWTPQGNATNETIGPSGQWGLRLQPTVVVRSYNDLGQASNMYFVPKDVPLSSRDTTVTTTTEEIEEEIETTEETTTESTTVTSTTTSTTTTTTIYLASEVGEAAFQQAQDAGMPDTQAAQIAAAVAGLAAQQVAAQQYRWQRVSMIAAQAAYKAGQAADLANASCVQAAVTAAGTATTDLHILEGSMPKAGILRDTKQMAQKAGLKFGMTSEEAEAASANAESWASAKVAGLMAQRDAVAAGKGWWSVSMAAARAATKDAFKAGQGLKFTAAEAAAAAAGAAATQVTMAAGKTKMQVVKAAARVARNAGGNRGMSMDEADFAAAMAAGLAAVTELPPSTSGTTSTTSTSTVTVATTTIATTMTSTSTTTTTITTTSTTTETTTTSTTTTTTIYYAADLGANAFRQAQEEGMSDAQAAEIAAKVAGVASRQAAVTAGKPYDQVAMIAATAAYGAGKAAGMLPESACAEAAVTAAGAAVTEVLAAQKQSKAKILRAAQTWSVKAGLRYGLNDEEAQSEAANAEGHASARVAGLEAQQEAVEEGKGWWSVAMAAARAATKDAFEAGKGLKFTAAEAGASAAGAAAAEVLLAAGKEKSKVIQAAAHVAHKAGSHRGMTNAEAEFAAATAGAIAAVMETPKTTTTEEE